MPRFDTLDAMPLMTLPLRALPRYAIISITRYAAGRRYD